jgi:hypothetical protein
MASWLLDLTAAALVQDADLARFSGRISDSGEGRWTIAAAIDEAVPAPVLSAALYETVHLARRCGLPEQAAVCDGISVRRAQREALCEKMVTTKRDVFMNPSKWLSRRRRQWLVGLECNLYRPRHGRNPSNAVLADRSRLPPFSHRAGVVDVRRAAGVHGAVQSRRVGVRRDPDRPWSFGPLLTRLLVSRVSTTNPARDKQFFNFVDATRGRH